MRRALVPGLVVVVVGLTTARALLTWLAVDARQETRDLRSEIAAVQSTLGDLESQFGGGSSYLEPDSLADRLDTLARL